MKSLKLVSRYLDKPEPAGLSGAFEIASSDNSVNDPVSVLLIASTTVWHERE